jgi:pimeloyl-ACP methyl ester carboxylesterase
MKTKVMINSSIVGILTTPDNYTGKLAIVLFFHGFGTDKDEVGNTFLLTSEKLLKNDIASLRIDFRGFGESQGETSNLTVEDLVSDANDTLNYILKLDFIDHTRIGLCGFSLGAGISILIADKQRDIIKTMALLSPAGNLLEDFEGYFGTGEFSKLAQSENILEIDIGWRKIKLTKNFIESLKRNNLMASITTYKGAFFVAAGTNDFSCKHARKYNQVSKAENKELLLLEGNDHIFNAFDEKLSVIPKVTDEVTSWFKRTL